MNMGLLDRDIVRLLAWLVIVLASVLAHELGHATAGLLFGLQPAIELHGMGGTTSWSASHRTSHVQRIIISLAGPCTGLLLGGLVFALGSRFSADFALGQWIVGSLVFVNVIWGALNLLPMLPLDGGNVLHSVLDIVTHGRGARPAHIVSLVVSVASLGAAFWMGSLWCGLLAAFFASSNWQWLSQHRGTASGG
jgi:Zn-dependent protease